MLIIISGEIGVGKSTVCQKLVAMLRAGGMSCHGIITSKDALHNIVIEDIASAEKMVLASPGGGFSGPATSRYSFSPAAISFGLRALARSPADVCMVDEVGQLELRGEGFACVLDLVKQGGFSHYVLVIRSFLLPSYLPQLAARPLVFETTPQNRGQLAATIARVLLECKPEGIDRAA